MTKRSQSGTPPHQNDNLHPRRKVGVYFWCGGQSLVEILVGVGIISIMVGASTYALVAVLRNSTVTEQYQSAGLIENGLLESAFTLAEANWNSIYNLQKTSANHYFLIASSAAMVTPVLGDESVLDRDITYGLAGHWKFDESSGTSAYDSSGKGNLGALINGPARTASAGCKVGACLSFDGSTNYVSIVNPSRFNIIGTGNFSVGAWIKVPVTKITTGYILNLKKASSNDPHIEFYVNYPNAGNIGAMVMSGGNFRATHSTAAINDNKWHYVYLVYTAGSTGTGTIYLDGVSAARASGSGIGFLTNLDYGSIGRSASGEYFNGSIDDLRIYNRALSSAEISQLYNSSVYSRYFYVSNVNRKVCGSGDVVATATTTCTGNANDVSEDPSTQKITAGASWNIKGVSGTLENSIFATRWVNSVSEQSAWGGSDGVTGAVSDFGGNYFEYSGISTTTSGSIKISGI